ncbi:pilin [Streptomyces umbrinus]|uniref:pilin n=1 Tax=Streptomyces umbrinus TaxID=67370 RepID=UPI003C2C1B53
MCLISPSSRRAETANGAASHEAQPRFRSPGFRRGLLLVGLTLVALVVVVTRAHAATEPVQVLALAESVDAVLDNIRDWIMGILAGLATVFLSLGGVRYVMANGDPGEVEKAKTAFKSASWGYGLAALAPLVVEILKGIVGA